MFNREEGNTYPRSPMGGSGMGATLVDALQRKQTPVPSTTDELIKRLVTAYNNKAYGNPIAPMLRQGQASGATIDGNPYVSDILSAWTKGGDRLGFLSRDKRPYGVDYGIAIDNMGDPYRGVLDEEVNTPFGTLGYGYDGDTVGASFMPNDKTQAYINALSRLLGR